MPSLLIKTKWTWASTITSSRFAIIWFTKKRSFLIDLIKDLTVNSSSKWADLYIQYYDLTIINELNWSWTFLLLKPIENKASVLALSKYLDN